MLGLLLDIENSIAISSESKGYDENGGVSADRHYHVPILHRTYDCRHGKTLYTLYAVGLAAVAAPGIMKPGVIFPEFLATGADSVHNPVNLLLEESRKIWPGVRIGLLIRQVPQLLHMYIYEADLITALTQAPLVLMIQS